MNVEELKTSDRIIFECNDCVAPDKINMKKIEELYKELST